jgi:hypothetical protein
VRSTNYEAPQYAGEISGSHRGNVKMAVFWNVAQCSKEEVCRHESVSPSETSENFYHTAWQKTVFFIHNMQFSPALLLFHLRATHSPQQFL